jgi:two-component system response regulator MprA
VPDRPRRILVVEDDDAIATLVQQALLDEGGYEVRRARDGVEALDVLGGWRPDVIVLDLMMPRMDGWRFREEQRRRAIAPDVPILVASASRRIDGLDADFARAVIRKPFDLDELITRVGELAG